MTYEEKIESNRQNILQLSKSMNEPAQAVYFTDDPKAPLFIVGTKKEAMKAARGYLKEVGVKAKIDRIETL